MKGVIFIFLAVLELLDLTHGLACTDIVAEIVQDFYDTEMKIDSGHIVYKEGLSIFFLFDVNGDGIIDDEELWRGVYKYYPAILPVLGGFKPALDVNKDSKLQESELIDFQWHADKNGDRKVSKKEYLSFWSKAMAGAFKKSGYNPAGCTW